jgi:hypothetical protein
MAATSLGSHPSQNTAMANICFSQNANFYKNKNESDQEETTDAWGFEKPSTSGIPQTPQKVKTISWKQGVYGIRFKNNIRNLINISQYIYEQLLSCCGVMFLTHPEIF